MCGAPKPSAPPQSEPEIVERSDEQVKDDATAERARRRVATGRKSTVVIGGLGAGGQPDTSRAVLLGG
jgi:hypothetical protein